MTVSHEDIARALRLPLSAKLTQWKGDGAFFSFEEFRDDLIAGGLLHDTATIRARFRAFCNLGVFEPVRPSVKYGRVWVSAPIWNAQFPTCRIVELVSVIGEREGERERGFCQTIVTTEAGE